MKDKQPKNPATVDRAMGFGLTFFSRTPHPPTVESAPSGTKADGFHFQPQAGNTRVLTFWTGRKDGDSWCEGGHRRPLPLPGAQKIFKYKFISICNLPLVSFQNPKVFFVVVVVVVVFYSFILSFSLSGFAELLTSPWLEVQVISCLYNKQIIKRDFRAELDWKRT